AFSAGYSPFTPFVRTPRTASFGTISTTPDCAMKESSAASSWPCGILKSAADAWPAVASAIALAPSSNAVVLIFNMIPPSIPAPRADVLKTSARDHDRAAASFDMEPQRFLRQTHKGLCAVDRKGAAECERAGIIACDGQLFIVVAVEFLHRRSDARVIENEHAIAPAEIALQELHRLL